MKSFTPLLVISVLLWSPILAAQDCIDYSLDYPDPSPAGPRVHGPGLVADVTVASNILCMGTDSCIQVFDVADPVAPVFLSTIDLMADCLLLHRDVLYAGSRFGGLDVIDLSDPEHPVIGDGLPLPEGALDLAVRGDFLYVALGIYDSGLTIIDIGDPLAPVRRGTAVSLVGLSVAVDDTRAYLVAPSIDDDSSYLTSLDIIDPDNPRIIGSVGITGRAQHAAVIDDVLFVPTDSQGLKLYDVSSSTGAYLIQTITKLIGGGDIRLQPPYGYTTTTNGAGLTQVHVLDIQAPAAPEILGVADLAGGPQGLAESAGWIYVATGELEPELVDARVPTDPVTLDWNGDTGLISLYAAGVATYGDLAYVGVPSVGESLLIYDLSQPGAPVLVGAVAGADRGGAVSIHGDLLYQLVDPVDSVPANRLLVYSLAEPTAPALIGSLDLATFQLYLNAGPGAVYLPLNGSIRVIDTGDPTAPVDMGSINPPGFGVTTHVAIAGGVAYCAMGQDGLLTYDVSTPTQMIALGGIDFGSADKVAVQGDVAVVTTTSDEFLVLDVGDPVAPAILARVPTSGGTRGVALDGPLAMITGGEGQVWIYDLADPTAPEEIGWTQLVTVPGAVGLAGPWLVAAAGTHGLELAWRACHDGVGSVDLPESGLRLAACPNPFNPAVTLSFTLAEPCAVNLGVYDLRGRHLATLASGPLTDGPHSIVWRGLDAAGRSLASGAYLLRLDAGGQTYRHTVTLIR